MDKPTRWNFFNAFSIESQINIRTHKTEQFSILEKEDFIESLREAESGNGEEQLRIAFCYQFGNYVKASKRKAFEYFQLSAQSGSDIALYHLGRCFLDGEGVTRSGERAFYCFKKAAEAGIQQAMYPLAKCYLQGTGVDRDYKTAHSLLMNCADLRDAFACEKLAEMYRDGLGVDQSAEISDYFLIKAANSYEMEANNGSAFAQVVIGDFFMQGTGVNKSEERAIDYYLKAANQNYPMAKVRLAKCYSQGIGVEKSDGKAIKLFEEAIELDMEYKFDYAEFLLENNINQTKAIQYLKELAQALPNSNCYKEFALHKLAVCYEEGIGVNVCDQTALRFYRLAADLDDPTSCRRLGAAFLEGDLGLCQNKQFGLKFFKMAIDLGSTGAWIMLGRYFFNGIGVKKSYKKSKRCFANAKANGFDVTRHLQACDYKLTKLNQKLGHEFLHKRRWTNGYFDRRQTT